MERVPREPAHREQDYHGHHHFEAAGLLVLEVLVPHEVHVPGGLLCPQFKEHVRVKNTKNGQGNAVLERHENEGVDVKGLEALPHRVVVVQGVDGGVIKVVAQHLVS